jgi:hypothetical protein
LVEGKVLDVPPVSSIYHLLFSLPAPHNLSLEENEKVFGFLILLAILPVKFAQLFIRSDILPI